MLKSRALLDALCGGNTLVSSQLLYESPVSLGYLSRGGTNDDFVK
jgi:hypothetical protein